MKRPNTNIENSTLLVTGAAGFIGSSLIDRLFLDFDNIHIVGIDNMSDYYDTNLKEYRLSRIRQRQKRGSQTWKFVKGNISDKQLIDNLFNEHNFSVVINLAAQAGVRYSITNPNAYIESNIVGFYNILEACRHHDVKHLVYASSSSVYGNSKEVPFKIGDDTDKPISLYAATKKSNELMAYTYGKLYGIPITGLRLFTVYGPAGRPDMAYFDFTNQLTKGGSIQLFNNGENQRDFTYIDDIVNGIISVAKHAPDNGSRIYNIGNGNPVKVSDFVYILKEELALAGLLPSNYDFESHIELVPTQAGDVSFTFADMTAFKEDFGYSPSTGIREGLRKFVSWYKEYTEHRYLYKK